MQSYLDAMRHAFDFRNRSNRREFWMFFLMVMLGSFVAAIVDAIAGIQIISDLWSLAHIVPQFSLAWRRLHDIDRTGWWLFSPWAALLLTILFLFQNPREPTDNGTGPLFWMMIIGFVGFFGLCITLLVFFCMRGTDGPNRFDRGQTVKQLEETFS